MLRGTIQEPSFRVAMLKRNWHRRGLYKQPADDVFGKIDPGSYRTGSYRNGTSVWQSKTERAATFTIYRFTLKFP